MAIAPPPRSGATRSDPRRRKHERAGSDPGPFRLCRKGCQPACKPGSGWPGDRSPDVTAIPLGRALLRASSNQPGRLDLETGPSSLAGEHRPYSVLLPVGLAMPSPLPGPRCALTAPFHPYPVPKHRAVRSLWRFPWGRPRRTLSGTVFPWSPDFPPPQAGAAVRPTGGLPLRSKGRSRQAGKRWMGGQLLAEMVRALPEMLRTLAQ